MTLDFTSIPDRQGPAVYLLGLPPNEEALRQLGQEITVATAGAAQVVYLDSASADGIQVSEFYDVTIESLPAVLIVQDDDALYQSWTRSNLPAADVVTHYINQITGNR